MAGSWRVLDGVNSFIRRTVHIEAGMLLRNWKLLFVGGAETDWFLLL